MRMIGSLAFPVLLLSAFSMFAEQEITIAAAADLQPVMQELATRFESQTHSKVRLSFGSSGNFFAQIQNGAWLDFFHFSCCSVLGYLPLRGKNSQLPPPPTCNR